VIRYIIRPPLCIRSCGLSLKDKESEVVGLLRDRPCAVCQFNPDGSVIQENPIFGTGLHYCLKSVTADNSVRKVALFMFQLKRQHDSV